MAAIQEDAHNKSLMREITYSERQETTFSKDIVNVPVVDLAIRELITELQLIVYRIKCVQFECASLTEDNWVRIFDTRILLDGNIRKCIDLMKPFKEIKMFNFCDDAAPEVFIETTFDEIRETFRKISAVYLGKEITGFPSNVLGINFKPEFDAITEKTLTEVYQIIKILKSVKFCSNDDGSIVTHDVLSSKEMVNNATRELIDDLTAIRIAIHITNNRLDEITDETWPAFIKLRGNLLSTANGEVRGSGLNFFHHIENSGFENQLHMFIKDHVLNVANSVCMVLISANVSIMADIARHTSKRNFSYCSGWFQRIHEALIDSMRKIDISIKLLRSIEIHGGCVSSSF